MKTKRVNIAWRVILLSLVASVNTMVASADSPSVLSRSVVIGETKETKEYKSLSKDFTTANQDGVTYYQSKDRYFIETDEGYKLVSPPAGIKIAELPRGYVSLTVVNRTYYSYKGVLYKDSSNGGYETTQPEVGMSLPELPNADIREVLIDGDRYFEANGLVYKPVLEGEQYVVICTLESLKA